MQQDTKGQGRSRLRPPQWSVSESDKGIEVAEIEVPLDYSQPAGRHISLAISRRPATDPARRRGILLSVNGGPGGDAGDGRRMPVILGRTPLAEVYDLIGFDPRGTGESTRLNAETTVPQAPLDSRPPDSAFALIAEDMRQRDLACQRAGGDLRPHVSTRNTARDMDLIRDLLGEDRINFIGWAYGSMVGAVYGTMFGARLDRSVLDSCVHPDWDWRQQFMSQGLAVRESVDQWAQWTGERHEHFGLGTSAADVLESVEDIAAILAGELSSVALRTSFDARVGGMAPYRPQWAELGDLVGELRSATAARDGEKAESLLANKAKWRPGDSQGLREAVLEAVTCETPWPDDLESYYPNMRLFRERYPYAFGVMRAQPWVGTFRTFKPPEEPTTVARTDYPAGIVVQADSDPWDYRVGGFTMAERLGHRLITVADSGAHEIYVHGGNSDVDFHVNRYLIEGILPPERVVCAGAARPAIPADQVRSVTA
jgi:pimeloyl-ACP methyl ester carboxylesterase